MSHDLIRDGERYFNLATLDPNHEQYDPCGGGDPVRSIGQYDYKEDGSKKTPSAPKGPIWLRYEPFILHVMCRSLSAAAALMAAARPAFKNVGLTSFSDTKFLVAIWGDEGVDMPLSPPTGESEGEESTFLFAGQESWLRELVNERHRRNWQKIDRFVSAVEHMPKIVDDIASAWVEDSSNENRTQPDSEQKGAPKRFDIIGDVALLHSMPECDTDEEREAIGKAIMARNKVIKIVAVRSRSLSGMERSAGEDGIQIIAGMQRSPLITSHMEYGVKCIIDLNHTFFSTRMGPERLRICQQVARGENVLVLFSGVGMDAMQIAARTEATVTAVEWNPIAVECAKRGQRMLVRNKTVKCAGAAERLTILEGDALEIMKTLPIGSFDRILAPRPKEGNMDGDLGKGDGGSIFLNQLLPLLKDQGECHWYDFAADHELPQCQRTQKTIDDACQRHGLEAEVIHVANVGSIAKRQIRICMDFRVLRISS